MEIVGFSLGLTAIAVLTVAGWLAQRGTYSFAEAARDGSGVFALYWLLVLRGGFRIWDRLERAQDIVDQARGRHPLLVVLFCIGVPLNFYIPFMLCGALSSWGIDLLRGDRWPIGIIFVPIGALAALGCLFKAFEDPCLIVKARILDRKRAQQKRSTNCQSSAEWSSATHQ